MTEPTAAATSGLNGWRYWSTWVFAVALAIVFVLACLLLFFVANDTGVDEKLWSRYVYLYGGLQAVVFTAVGWIFGREVNRTTAETATRQEATTRKQLESATALASGATVDAKAAREANLTLTEQAAQGRALAEAVRSLADPVRARSADLTMAPGVSAQLDSLKGLADKLFPPR